MNKPTTNWLKIWNTRLNKFVFKSQVTKSIESRSANM